jgi:hypothetical protein
MGFKKGFSGNAAGRPKGAKNKLPRNLVDRVLGISANLEEQGKGLQDCAEKDPKWFFENFIKPILPKNVDLSHEGRIGLVPERSEHIEKLLSEIYQSEPNRPKRLPSN